MHAKNDAVNFNIQKFVGNARFFLDELRIFIVPPQVGKISREKKGFQPMQISWNPYVVDALFRAGDVHCNHGADFMKAVGRLAKAVRRPGSSF